MTYAGQLNEQHKERQAKFFPKPRKEKPVEVAPAAVEAQVISELRAQVYSLTQELTKLKLKYQQAIGLTPDEPLPPAQPTVARIKEIVAAHYEVGVLDLESQTRDYKHLIPRHVAMYLCRKFTTRSFPFIGRHFGGRDHTTALSAFRRVGDNRTIDDELNADLVTLEKALAP